MRIYLYIMTIVTIALSSCTKKYLDIKSNTYLYRQSYVKDAKTLRDFVNGIYLTLMSPGEAGSASGYAELVADNLKPVSVGRLMHFPYNWQQQIDPTDNNVVIYDPEMKSVNPIWKIGYFIVKNSNFVLEEADKYRSEDATLIDHLKGDAYAFRALLHFKILNVFAQHYTFTNDASHPGIPYVTTSFDKVFKRLSVKEVYDKIITDLEHAEQLIPATAIDTRMFTRASVKAILSRVYLFKENYAKAMQYAKEVADDHPLMKIAEGYPRAIFEYHAGDANSENLFQLSPQGSLLNFYLTTSKSWSATNDIADILLENVNDVRSSWVTGTANSWTVNKFPANAAPGVMPVPNAASSYYHAMIRSSELFLTMAECAAKTGDIKTAQDYLNAIRQRANPAAAAITPAGPALIDSIYKERRKELCFEGLRMFDLQRWKLGVHRMDVLPGSPKILSYPNDKAIAPIPPNDVKLAGLAQNPGY